MNYSRKIIVVSLISFLACHTLLHCNEYDVVEGVHLKFNASLTTLGKKAPAEVAQSVYDWCAKNPHLVRHFSGHEAFRPSEKYPVPPVTSEKREDRIAYFESTKKEFADAGFPTPNESVNSVIRIAPGLMLKAAGYLNMQQIINASLGNQYGQKLTVEDLQRFERECGGKTYQTATRFMGHLNVEKGIKALYSLGNPERYLVALPGQEEMYDPCDGTCVVIERVVEGKIKKLSESLAALNPTRIEHLVRMGAYVPLWCISGDNLGFSQGTVWILDTEFPNNLPASENYISKEKHQSLVRHGWAELENNIIKPAAERFGIDPTPLLKHKKRIQEEIEAEWLKN
jgi:hypothetical protein